MDAAAEMGRPAKLALVDYWSKAVWYQLGSMARLDPDGQGYLTRDHVAAAVADHFGGAVADICIDNIMRVADADKVSKRRKGDPMP